MNRLKFEKFDFLFIAGAIILLATLLYYIRDTLSPPLITILLILLLLPFRKQRIIKYMMGVVVFVFMIWFVRDTRNLLTPFVLSFALAYLFDPIVVRMEMWKMPF